MDRVNIMEQQWDYLIILDACRYDYMEQVWQNYFIGKFTKKISIGSSTLEWRDKTFKKYYDDVIFISANPYINSISQTKGFSAKEHFYKVYDVWRDNWDNEKKAVLPEEMTRAAIDIIRRNPHKRAIIHYIQPHTPYVGPNTPFFDFHKPEPLSEKLIDKDTQRQRKKNIKDRILRTISDFCYQKGITGRFSLWRIRKFLKLPPMSHMDAIRRNLGKEGLRLAYKENLDIVLKHVVKLVDAISGKIVITADHGELLGERGLYSHWPGSKNKLLIEIPWLEIEKDSKTESQKLESPENNLLDTNSSKDSEEAIQKEIADKLRALGYHD